MAILNVILLSAQTKIPIQEKETTLEVSNNTGLSFNATFTISEFALSTVETEGGLFTRLDLPDFTKRYDNGRPAIPTFNKLIELPAGNLPQINVISYDVIEFDLKDLGFSNKIMPSQPSYSKSADPSDIKYYYDKDFYEIDAFSNNELITVESSGDMRGVKFGNLIIDPISYNPVKNIIEIKYNIKFTVTFSAYGYQEYMSEKGRLYSVMHEGFYSSLPNFTAPPTKDVITQYPIKYVIVSDPAFQSALQPFVKWKTEKGFNVIEAYTNNPSVGNTTTSIKNYLQGLYNAGTSSDPAPTYVLFVGDIAQIPSFACSGTAYGSSYSHYSDLYFACYGGAADNIPDLYYGRFSATNTTHVNNQVSKTLVYEKYTMPSANYMDTVLLVAGYDDYNHDATHGNGQINYATSMYFNAAHNIYPVKILDPNNSEASAGTTVRSTVYKGVGYANYTAHCSASGWAEPQFSTSQVANMTNNNKYGLLVGNCCQSNMFDQAECFGERILRAYSDRGAVGYIGASDYSYWDEDYYWGVGNRSSISANPTYNSSNLGAYDCAFHENGEATTKWFVTNGQMLHAGLLAVQASSSSIKKYYWEEYHLMGDPSVMNYFSKPTALTISYPSPAHVGNTSLVVNTEKYTYVAISLNGVLLDAKYTGNNTSVTLSFPAFTSVDTAMIVATKQNKIPYIGELPIENAAVALDAQVFTIIKPQSSYSCVNITETPKIVIRNCGLNNLTSLNIKYKFNAGALQTASWSGNLSSFQSDTITLPNITIPSGTSNFIAYSVNPNGGTDLNTANDTAKTTITASNLPVSANFTLSATSFCAPPASIILNNLSENASSYLWTFGDGTSSNIAQPSHTYTSNGLFTITLTADAGICGADTHSETILVGAQPPQISNVSACSPQSFTLNATGSNINWYSDAGCTNLISTGNSYVTPVLSNTTTYYLLSSITSQNNVGKPNNLTGTGNYYTNNYSRYLIFNVEQPLKLKSVKVYANTSRNRTIWLKNSSGTTLSSKTQYVAAGTNPVLFTLDFDIPVGTGYQLGLTEMGSNNNLYYSDESEYPYTIPGLISITGNSNPSWPGLYYFFYDWVIETSCSSSVVPVQCQILSTPSANFSASATSICENSSITLNDASTGYPTNWSWSITPSSYTFTGGTSATSQNPKIQFDDAGNYSIQLTASNSCGSDIKTETNLITVNNIPDQPGTISGNASPCQNSTGLTYSVVNNPALTYNWSVPSGWNITSGNGTNSIIVNSGTASGNISVSADNQGCLGTPQILGVTIAPNPVVDLGQDTSICEDQIIILDAGNSGSNYTWSNSSTAQTITVDASMLSPGSVYIYEVTVTNSYGCSASDAISIEVIVCSNINEGEDAYVKVYPNPAQNYVVVKSSDLINNTEIIDTKGAVVFKDNTETYDINIGISNLSEGLYYIRITTQKGIVVLPLTIKN